MRVRSLLPALVLMGIASLGVPGAANADDTTPPVGTLEIENGLGYTNDTTVVLDVPATDDVEVVLVRAQRLGGPWTDFPYESRIEYTFGDPSDFSPQLVTIQVEWRDAAGNSSYASKEIWLDNVAPVLEAFSTTDDGASDGSAEFHLWTYDEGLGPVAIRFSTDNGAHWGADVPWATDVVWDLRDAAFGGKPKGLGTVTVLAKVRDGAGLWSNVRSAKVEYTASVKLDVSSDPTTGEPITFTPQWSDAVALPAGTHCSWEFMTGNEPALFSGEHDDSYSYNLTQGPVGGGWCKPWTFTLPWSPVRLYLVAFRVMLPDGSEVYAELGSPGVRAFTSTVGSTSRAIRSSNLPLFYILPDDDHLTVGVPTTYRAFAIGGATIRSTDRWSVVQYGPSSYRDGGSSYTFTPQRAGHVTVCLQRRHGDTPMDQLGACFDPVVRRAAGSTTSSPDPAVAPSAASPASADPSSVPTVVPSPETAVLPSAAPGPSVVAGGPVAPTSEPVVTPAATTDATGTAWLLVALLVGAGALGGGIAWRRGWRPPQARRGTG